MTVVAIDWLPTDAFTEDAVSAVLAETINRWSERWLARRPAVVSSFCGINDEFALDGAGMVDAQLSGRGKRILLEAILDADLSEQSLKEGDHQVLDALAVTATKDLVAATETLFCADVGRGARVILSLSIDGIEILYLNMPEHVLVPLLKARLGGARQEGKALRHRLEALKPVRLVAEGVLGEADIALEDLSGLAVGDVVILDRRIHEPVELRLSGSGHLIGAGRLGRSGSQISIQF